MSTNRRRTIANSVGILEYNTWRYYVNNFGCSHFKGIDTEDNYYLFRPIYLLDGKPVNSRKRFWQANAEVPLIRGRDFIISGHQAAVSVAKYIYHPTLIEQADLEIIYDYAVLQPPPRH
jgi:hypothetical protein